MSIEGWLLLLSIILCVISFMKFIINKENKERGKALDWRFILIVLLFLLIFSVIGFDVLSRNKYSLNTIRNITTFLTLVIAVVSFITTVGLTNKNSQTNRENKNSDFLMSLMKNNYDLLNSKNNSIDKLIEKLNDQFSNNVYLIDKSRVLFKKHMDSLHPTVLKEKISDLEKMVDDSGKKDKLTRDLKHIQALNDNDNDEAISRLFISYYLNKPQHEKNFQKLLSGSQNNKSFSSDFINLLQKENGLFVVVDKFMKSHESEIMKELSYDDVCLICNKIFDDAYQDVGHFFRNSYRIVKLINEFYKNDQSNKSIYQGILRAQYGENVILAIYYNSVFTPKGLGYARELLGSDFFGSHEDLQLDDPIHFRKDSLFFSTRNLRLMKKMFISNRNLKNYNDLEELKKDMKTAFENS
ncbi:putative phage abortive infection protein [Priestia megaterium]